MRTTLRALEEQCRPKQSIEILKLPEEDFRQIVTGTGDLDYYKSLLPDSVHDFLSVCFAQDIDKIRAVLLQKISKEDATKFFSKSDASATPLSIKEAQKQLPVEFQDLADIALPQDADKLPPHRAYDHKIKL